MSMVAIVTAGVNIAVTLFEGLAAFMCKARGFSGIHWPFFPEAGNARWIFFAIDGKFF